MTDQAITREVLADELMQLARVGDFTLEECAILDQASIILEKPRTQENE